VAGGELRALAWRQCVWLCRWMDGAVVGDVAAAGGGGPVSTFTGALWEPTAGTGSAPRR
jgi:hypothetical protein